MTDPYYQANNITIFHGDCRDVMRTLANHSVDAIVTDPPYELGFMGKHWDRSGIAYNPRVWRECLRVLKPGGHLLAFGGSRTYHRLACAVEDVGFEIRDQIQWIYGSGFPKSLDVSKAIDAAAGAEREVIGARPNVDGGGIRERTEIDTAASTDAAKQWDGWGTALKPAHEPIVLARKPLIGTVAENVLKHGTGGLNVDGCRIETSENLNGGGYTPRAKGNAWEETKGMNAAGRCANEPFVQPTGRWPANVIHDGSDEVLAGFPDSGSAARFFYCAKASKSDRDQDNKHTTVKPTKLMRYLVRLITPPNGVVLDPFAGSGSTGKACLLEGIKSILIEKEIDYCEIAVRRAKLQQQSRALDLFA